MEPRRYRVAQWGTGHSGLESLRSAISHPSLELVALRCYDPNKIGKDAGAICGLAETGVLATDSRDAIIAARPDCVLYFPATGMASLDDICALLEAGVNIVTLLSEYYHAPSLDPEVRARVEKACADGGSSLYATGPDPGFASNILPLAAISFQRRLDKVTLYEFADMSSRTAGMNRAMWGWKPSEDRFGAHAARMVQGFGEPMRQLFDAIGLPLDDITSEGIVALATQDVEIASMTIEQGTVAGVRFEINGLRKGRVLYTFYSTWWVTEHIDKDWPLRDVDGWRLVVEGDTPLDISVRFAEAYGETGNSSGYNAHIVVNAAPSVCDAAPGILTVADLPPIVARFVDQ